MIIGMTTTIEEIDAKIKDAEERQHLAEHRFAVITTELREIRDELSELESQKAILSEADFVHDAKAFEMLCKKALAQPKSVFRKKFNEVVHSFPLPAGIEITSVLLGSDDLMHRNPEVVLTLGFKQGQRFTHDDAEKLMHLIDTLDLMDGFREHTPVMVSEYSQNENGNYKIVFDKDNEHARLYRSFFHEVDVVEDGTIAEVLTAVARDYYYTKDESIYPDWDSDGE